MYLRISCVPTIRLKCWVGLETFAKRAWDNIVVVPVLKLEDLET